MCEFNRVLIHSEIQSKAVDDLLMMNSCVMISMKFVFLLQSLQQQQNEERKLFHLVDDGLDNN
jgi:hypothetical protein